MRTDTHLSESVTISAHQWLKGLEQNRRKRERSGSISAHRQRRAMERRAISAIACQLNFARSRASLSRSLAIEALVPPGLSPWPAIMRRDL